MDYRKLYEKFFGEIPEGFDIHHIDLNRENNEIANLVAVPKDLHIEYHNLINNLEAAKHDFKANLITNGYGNQGLIERLKKLEIILKKFDYYLNVRGIIIG